MVGNIWCDRAQERTAYNIEDPEVRLLTAGAGVDPDTEIDPMQRAAGVDGPEVASTHGSPWRYDNLSPGGLRRVAGGSRR